MNEHVALLSENHEERFAAVTPFLKQGLDRGERCMYVVDGTSRADVLESLRAADVDVDAALDSGALTFHTVEETYLRNGSFDADGMLEFYADAVEATTAEYEALRVTAEMGWVLRDGTDLEEFMEYESRVNRLFRDEDAIALCQYDYEATPPNVLRDVIKTHPHLIYDGTVFHNIYYIPPEEFFGPRRAEAEAEQMLATLLDRAETRTELDAHQSSLRRLNEITADPNRSFEGKLESLFELGRERFGLELGAMARVDVGADGFEVEHVGGDRGRFEPGVELSLSETYCPAAIGNGAAGSVTEPEAEGYGDAVVRREFGLRTYLGTHVEVDGGPDRTFFFASSEPRTGGFTDAECTFLKLMGQWVKGELERRKRERALEASNERLEQFAYAASHDLQEPLRMVSSYLQLVERRTDGDLPEECEEFIEFAVDGADRMRNMIDGLLAYSRVGTGEEPFEPVDLETVVADVRNDLGLQIEEIDATITADPLPTVAGDGGQLRQLLQNLLDNAMEYNCEGTPEVHVSAERTGSDWTVSVRDDGIGIDPDDAERVFDVFERLHGRKCHEGTGIGLALCERIVERHDGEIWVEPGREDGTTVSFTLPAAG
ncbi:MEDS domain-containing protein [Halorarum salinum]|uniref:histidine kinase n=2 Tax=Halorarum salinum TaxID=2743089 RepID=A0A7D5LCX1_9EURY|nr:MEDS domain-containing protein [Halobaculum salinum]